MYITRVKLENIRGFRELDLSFLSSGESVENEVRKWTVLLGDNATGKTTLLKCIAFGLCDESSAAGLVSDRTEAFIRHDESKGMVYIELHDEEGNRYWTIATKLSNQPSTGEQVEQKVRDCRIDEFNWDEGDVNLGKSPWDSLFVAGYGAGRTPEGSTKYEAYRRIDAVYTLFDYQQPLQDPELVWRRHLAAARNNALEGTKDTAEKDADLRVKKLLRDVLVLRADEEIFLDDNGIKVSDRPGYELPLSSHSDGYKASAVWLLDLISWRLMYDKGLDPKSMKGIVLIDEIEQHLHPRWQRYIISRLQSQFPEVQFIATTHSPLCVLGTTELDDKDCELTVLQRREDNVLSVNTSIPRNKRADQILTSPLFGLSTSGDNKQKGQINRFAELASKERSNEEEKEFHSLEGELDNTIGSGETPLEESVAQAVRRELQGTPDLSDYPQKAVDYEIARQLREIFGVSDQ